MLKSFKDFKKSSLNEGNIYNYPYLSDEQERKFKEKLKPYEDILNKLSFELDKIYNLILGDSIGNIIEKGVEYYSDILDNIEDMNDKADKHSSSIDDWIANLPENEYESEWDGIDIVQYNLYVEKVRDKYSALETLLEEIKDIANIDFETFKNNSANIIINNDEPRRLGK